MGAGVGLRGMVERKPQIARWTWLDWGELGGECLRAGGLGGLLQGEVEIKIKNLPSRHNYLLKTVSVNRILREE